MQKLENHQSNRKSDRNPSLQQLKKKAIAGPTECEFCDILFDDIDAFDEHMETTHLLQWRCNLCECSFKSCSEYVFHKAQNHNGNYVLCKSCVSSTNDNNEQSAAVQQNESTFLPKQSSVANSISNPQDKSDCLNKEETTVTDKNQLCSSSNTTISTDPNKKLQGSSSNRKKIQASALFCEVCKICFGDEWHFSAHQKIHDVKRITCSACFKRCTSIYDLYLHKRQIHNKYKKVQVKYFCDQCNKLFTNSWQWDTHRKVCTNVCRTGFACKYCKRICATRNQLDSHLQRHRTEILNDPAFAFLLPIFK